MSSIQNIVNLPPEILLTIFTYLTPSDRRVASETCKRLLEIWLRDVFIADRRLVFDKSEFEPYLIFMKSRRKYRHLVFGEVFIRDAAAIVTAFGATVTTIEINRYFDEYLDNNLSFLSGFVNLKTLKVDDVDLLGDFSHVPRSLELLVISGEMVKRETFITNLRSNYLNSTSDSFRIELNSFIEAEQLLKFTDLQRNKIQRIQLWFSSTISAFKLPRMRNLKHLTLNFADRCKLRTEAMLDDVANQLPALEHLSLDIGNKLLHKNWSCLKTLDAYWLPTKKEILQLTLMNLKELFVYPNYGCFYEHETFLGRNLTKISMYAGSSCYSCFKHMTKSFPELEHLTCAFSVQNIYLNQLATNSPKLKHLRLESFPEYDEFGFSVHFDSSLSFHYLPNLSELILDDVFIINANTVETWPFMQHLRKFKGCLDQLNYETVQIFEEMPSLEDLDVKCDVINCYQFELFDVMFQPLKRLKFLRFRCQNMRDKDFGEIVGLMTRSCKYLRCIDFPGKRMSDEFLEKLLKRYSSVRTINKKWRQLDGGVLEIQKLSFNEFLSQNYGQ